MTKGKTVLFISMFFLIGFGGFIFKHYTAPAAPQETAKEPAQQRADSLYTQFVAVEECVTRVNQEELSDYKECRPQRINLDPTYYFAELIRLARRGLEAERQLYFTSWERIAHYTRVIQEYGSLLIDTKISTTLFKVV